MAAPITPDMPYEIFINDIANRYKPISETGNIGIYVTGEDAGYATGSNGIKDILADIMGTNFWQSWQTAVFGKDPREYIIGCRFYYGLKSAVKLYPNNATPTAYAITVGDHVVMEPGTGTNYPKSAVTGTNMIQWETGYLRVPDVAHNSFSHGGMTTYLYGESYLNYIATYQLYLPYYGFVELNPTDIVGGYIKIVYNIDLCTGSTVIDVVCANPKVSLSQHGDASDEDYLLLSLSTKIGVDIPINVGVTQNATMFGMIAATQAFKTGASAGMSLGMGDLSAENSALTSKTIIAKSELDAAKKNYNIDPGSMALNALESKQTAFDSANADLADNKSRMASYASFAPAVHSIGNVNPPASPTRSNGVNEQTAGLTCLYPYLLITTPHPTNTSYEQAMISGQHVNKVAKMSDTKGFTQISGVVPQYNSSIPVPKYAADIIALLKAGVYTKNSSSDTTYPPAPTT